MEEWALHINYGSCPEEKLQSKSLAMALHGLSYYMCLLSKSLNIIEAFLFQY